MHGQVSRGLDGDRVRDQSMGLGQCVKGKGGTGVMFRMMGHVPGKLAQWPNTACGARILQHV